LTVMRRAGKPNCAFWQRRAYPLAAFLDLGLGQADEVERGQSVGQMHFDADQRGVHAGQRAGVDDGDVHLRRSGVRIGLGAGAGSPHRSRPLHRQPNEALSRAPVRLFRHIEFFTAASSDRNRQY